MLLLKSLGGNLFFTVTAHSLGKPENWPKRAFPVWWVFCHMGSEPLLETPKQAVPHCTIWGISDGALEVDVFCP